MKLTPVISFTSIIQAAFSYKSDLGSGAAAAASCISHTLLYPLKISHSFSYFHMLSHTFPDFLRLSHKTLSYFSDFRIRLYLISHHFSNFLMFSTLFICPHYFSLSPIHFFNFFVHFHTFSTLSLTHSFFRNFKHIFSFFSTFSYAFGTLPETYS